MIRMTCRFAVIAVLGSLGSLAVLGQTPRLAPPSVPSPDLKLIATAQGTQISIIDVQTQKVLCQIQGHTALIRTLAISPDGKTLVSGGNDKTIMFWDLATGKALRKFLVQDSVVNVSFSADGKNITSQEANKTVSVWDVATGQMIQSSKQP